MRIKTKHRLKRDKPDELVVLGRLSMSAFRVFRSLERIIECRGKQKVVRCDNGSEYLSRHLVTWIEKHRIQLQYIQPGKPQRNVYEERFNCTVST